PEVILPQTAHPAFDKAAHYLGLELIKTPVRGDYRADVRAMRRAITRRTVMLVGSAPQHAQGVVDPIAEIADLAAARGLLCHVDACVGGFMLPFVRTLGRPVPAFDFNVPGVTSMSADLHKYGWAAKGASVVLYHAPELRKLQFFATTDWPGGIYASPSMTGTRPGGAIAAAWAVMNRLGWEGYTEIAGEIMGAVDAIRDGISRLEGVSVMGDPHMSVFALQTDEVDPYEVADGLAARGWHIERQHSPPCLHLSVNGLHVGQTDAFLADLRSALGEVEPPTIAQRVLSLGRDVLLKAAASVLPRRVVSSAMDATSGRIVIDLLDQMTRYQPDEEIQFDELGERVEALALEEPVPEELFTVRTIRLEQAEPYRPTKRALRRALRRRLRRPMTLDAAIRVDEEHPHGLEEPLQRPLRLHDGPRHGHRP
ncbi:MAG: aminotransferase class V-fold PLP-dependent enzyme, partial [Myxococcota bacterium]